jgi:hypothetical protein
MNRQEQERRAALDMASFLQAGEIPERGENTSRQALIELANQLQGMKRDE